MNKNTIKKILKKSPKLNRVLIKSYKQVRYVVADKQFKTENVRRISPKDEYEYFYGYYDKSPWDISGQYILSLRVKSTLKDVAPAEKAEIVLFDELNDTFKIINNTSAWNVQQGCMLQWMGPDYNSNIIFNDYRDKNFCSVIYNVWTGKETIINSPIYDVSQDGSFGLSLDFTRLHSLRPGYGYSNEDDLSSQTKIPNDTAIWYIDFSENERYPLLSYSQLVNFETRHEMKKAYHGVNHIMISPNGDRVMFLHRWIKEGKRYTRLVTMDKDGTNLYNLNDDDMTSHSFWYDDSTILTYARKKSIGNGYFILKDKTQNYEYVFKKLSSDGHPSFSPNKTKVVTDTYPDYGRSQKIYIIKNNNIKNIASLYTPLKYDDDFRCDLHPRWNHDGTQISFDSTFEGKRGLYSIEIKED